MGTCTRCDEVTTGHEHTWNPYGYVNAGRCEQMRRCQRRCGTEEETESERAF